MEYIGIVYQGATLRVGWACWLSRKQSALLSSALLLLSLLASRLSCAVLDSLSITSLYSYHRSVRSICSSGILPAVRTVFQ